MGSPITVAYIGLSSGPRQPSGQPCRKGTLSSIVRTPPISASSRHARTGGQRKMSGKPMDAPACRWPARWLATPATSWARRLQSQRTRPQSRGMAPIGREAQVLARRDMDVRAGNHSSKRRTFNPVLTRVANTSPVPDAAAYGRLHPSCGPSRDADYSQCSSGFGSARADLGDRTAFNSGCDLRLPLFRYVDKMQT